MINISYQRLFNLKVSHDYYKDGLAKGVHMAPTSDTVDLLKNGRMLLKKLQHQSVVLYRGLNENPPVDPPNPFIPLEEDFRFTFALTVENKSEFINKTNLDATNPYHSSNMLYFINNPGAASNDPTAPENLNFSLLDSIRNSLFTYSFQLVPIPPNPSEVRLTVRPINDDGTLGATVEIGKDPNGVPITTPILLEIDAAGLGVYGQSIDLRNKKKGRYRIQVEDNANPGVFLREEDVYIHDELATQNILGIVDVIYKVSGPEIHAYGSTEEYNIQFARKQTFWKYIIVGKTGGVDITTYQIADAGVAAPPYVVNIFNPISAPAVIDDFINGNPAKIYRSNVLIDLFETPKLNIELEGDGGSRKIENLPNASPNSIIKKNEITEELESEIYVFL